MLVGSLQVEGLSEGELPDTKGQSMHRGVSISGLWKGLAASLVSNLRPLHCHCWEAGNLCLRGDPLTLHNTDLQHVVNDFNSTAPCVSEPMWWLSSLRESTMLHLHDWASPFLLSLLGESIATTKSVRRSLGRAKQCITPLQCYHSSNREWATP